MAQPEKPPPQAASSPPRSAAQEHRDGGLPAVVAALRDVLARGVVITAERLQEAIDESVERGRMTREDAEELVGNLVDIGRRQTRDVLADAERLLGRSADETRRVTTSGARSVGAAARRAPKSVLAAIEKRLA